jgi:uncharacterized phage protein gp47/JayE
MSGVTDTGFERKTLEQIVADLEARCRATIDPTIDTSAESPLGQLIGTIAAEIAEAWEGIEDAYHQFDPDAVEGVAQDNLCSLTGTVRRGEDSSQVVLTLSLNAGATVPAGALVSVDGRDDIVFETQEAVTNSGGSPSTRDVVAICQTPGPVAANSGTLTVIVTPHAGWTAVTNAADAELGSLVESDELLRARRELELARRGGSTTDAVRADLLAEFEDLETCIVLENTTDSVDSNGLPPHSIEALIDDGAVASIDNDEIAQVIHDSKAGGIGTWGNAVGTAEDSRGDEHLIKFSRPERRPVFINVTVAIKSADYAGNTAVREAIAAVGNALLAGEDVIALDLKHAPRSVAGVKDVPVLQLGFAAAPTGTANLGVLLRQRATFDPDDVTVTTTPWVEQ